MPCLTQDKDVTVANVQKPNEGKVFKLSTVPRPISNTANDNSEHKNIGFDQDSASKLDSIEDEYHQRKKIDSQLEQLERTNLHDYEKGYGIRDRDVLSDNVFDSLG